jgi:hypothetical protein
MNKAHVRRGRRVILTVLAVGLLTAVISAACGLAHAAVHRSSLAPKACVSKTRHGRFSGVVRAVPVDAACFAHNTSDAANGTPPLLWHGGPVMGTPSSRPVVVTPIYWDPAGHPISSSYKNIISTYLGDVAAASGQHSNVLWQVTGRHVLALPDPRLPGGAGANPNYTSQLRDTRGDLAHNHGLVVDLTGSLSRYLAARGHWPPPGQLAPHLGLAVPQGAGGDAILRPAAGGPEL